MITAMLVECPQKKRKKLTEQEQGIPTWKMILGLCRLERQRPFDEESRKDLEYIESELAKQPDTVIVTLPELNTVLMMHEPYGVRLARFVNRTFGDTED